MSAARVSAWLLIVVAGCGARSTPQAAAPSPAVVSVTTGPTKPSPIAIVGRVRVTEPDTAEAVARFERFVAEHPDDPRFTPDALLRLGSLYLDHADALLADAVDDPQLEQAAAVARRAAEVLADADARFPTYRRRDAVLYQLGYARELSGDGAGARAAYLALGAMAGSPLAAEGWFRAGERAFEDGDLPVAIDAYQRVARSSPLAGLTGFKLAWSRWRTGDMVTAAAAFQAVLDDPAAAELAPEARQYLALALVEDDQDGDGVVERAPVGASAASVARIRTYLGSGEAAARRAVAADAARALVDDARYPEALAVLDHLLTLRLASDERAGLVAARAEARRRAGLR